MLHLYLLSVINTFNLLVIGFEWLLSVTASKRHGQRTDASQEGAIGWAVESQLEQDPGLVKFLMIYFLKGQIKSLSR